MTCLTTHDIKRSEDVRARLGVLSEVADEWDDLVSTLQEATAEMRPAELDGRTENLWWQTLVGTSGETGPMAWDRLEGYLTKAMREAKTHTTWTSVDEAYESQVLWFAQATHADAAVRAAVNAWNERTAPGVRAAVLSQKLIQLTIPGVPDVYQGTETLAPLLVDPDNRREINFPALAGSLARLHGRSKPTTLADEKLLVTHRALHVRREHSEAFVGDAAGYQALASSSGHAVVFARTVRENAQVITVATRVALELDKLGGWGEHTVALPEGRWRDVIGRKTHEGGSAAVAAILKSSPVALLVRA
jgi:(1->4)-alpha-D-glucan 1-alpha-D-glucosylmutase